MNKIFLIFAGQPEANNFFNTRPKLIFIKYFNCVNVMFGFIFILIKYFNWEAVTPIKY